MSYLHTDIRGPFHIRRRTEAESDILCGLKVQPPDMSTRGPPTLTEPEALGAGEADCELEYVQYAPYR